MQKREIRSSRRCEVESLKRGLIVLLLFIAFAPLLGGSWGAANTQAQANRAQEGLAPEAKANILIKGNIIGDSGFGIYVGWRRDDITIMNNHIVDNGEGVRLVGTEGRDFLTGNTITDNVIGIKITDVHESKVFPNMAVSLINIQSNTIAGNLEHNLLNLTSRTLETANNSWEKTPKERKAGTSIKNCSSQAAPVVIPSFTPIPGASSVVLTLGLGMIDPSTFLSSHLNLTLATTIATINNREFTELSNAFLAPISLSGSSFSLLASPEIDKGH